MGEDGPGGWWRGEEWGHKTRKTTGTELLSAVIFIRTEYLLLISIDVIYFFFLFVRPYNICL